MSPKSAKSQNLGPTLFEYDDLVRSEEQKQQQMDADFFSEIDALARDLEAEKRRLEFLEIGEEACGCVDVALIAETPSGKKEVFIGEEGASVNLLDRNRALLRTLEIYGIQGRAGGMATALESPPADLDIINRYGNLGTALKISGLGLLKAAKLNEESDNQWNIAYGSKSMEEHNLDGKDVLQEARLDKSLHQLKFRGKDNENARRNERNKLRKQAKKLEASD